MSITQRKRIVLKFLFKTEIPREEYFKDDKNLEDAVFMTRYYEIWRYYHFHFTHTEEDEKTQSFSYMPLVGLLKGVFLNDSVA